MSDHAPNPNASAICAETTGSILISYSRRDRDAVKQLYGDLAGLGFKLWRRTTALFIDWLVRIYLPNYNPHSFYSRNQDQNHGRTH